MPEVPQQEIGAAALGVRRLGKRLGQQRSLGRTMRQLRRCPRPGRLRYARHELILSPTSPAPSFAKSLNHPILSALSLVTLGTSWSNRRKFSSS
jgi:hypothetical protein